MVVISIYTCSDEPTENHMSLLLHSALQSCLAADLQHLVVCQTAKQPF